MQRVIFLFTYSCEVHAACCACEFSISFLLFVTFIMASACKKIRKTYKHDEKIICLYCDNEMFYKNLKSHTDNKHGCKPVKYRAKSSKSLSEMWNKPVCVPEIETNQEEDTISNTVVID